MISTKKLNKLFNVPFSVLLTLFLAFSVVGCGGCEAPSKGKKTTDKPKGTPKNNVKKVVALIHGLGAPDDLQDVEAAFKRDLAGYEIIRLVRRNSTTVSTTQQAEEMYNQLTEQLTQKGLEKPSICLLGDSHGGLVALEMYRLHKDDLDIKGIITNHSPLEGAPGLNASPDAVKKFKNALINILVRSGDPSLGLAAVYLGSLDFRSILVDGIQPVVIQDLIKDSELLKHIQLTLSSIEIPVLLLAGNVNIKIGIIALLQFALGDVNIPLVNVAEAINQFSKNLDKIAPGNRLLTDLEATFGSVIGDKENDCFVPFYSQTAKDIAKSPQVRALDNTYYHHFYGMTSDQGMYTKMIEFIKSAFEVNK